jgi:hypothetical protein
VVEQKRWTRSRGHVTCRRCRTSRVWKAVVGAVLAALLAGCASDAGLENLPPTTESAGSILVQRQARGQAATQPRAPRRSIEAAQIADHLAARWTGKRNTHEREREVRRDRRRERRRHR